jgi:hypothetical protein
VGRATATKDEMIDWAYKLYPNLNWLTHGFQAPRKADGCQ